MDLEDINNCKNDIVNEIENIIVYVKNFEVHSAKDEKALEDIYGMVSSLTKKMSEIEEAHRRRIELTDELMRTLGELENSHKKFAEKYSKKE